MICPPVGCVLGTVESRKRRWLFSGKVKEGLLEAGDRLDFEGMYISLPGGKQER